MKKYYTITGSATMDADTITSIQRLIIPLENEEYIMRTSGPDPKVCGIHEIAHKLVRNKETYIPWSGFNTMKIDRDTTVINDTPSVDIALKQYFPDYRERLNQNSIFFFRRNMAMLLGKNLKEEDKSSFVLASYDPTQPLPEQKGTSMFLVSAANRVGIPVFNVGDYADLAMAEEEFWNFLDELEDTEMEMQR